MYTVYFISPRLFHLGLPKYHKIIKVKVNFVHFIVLLTDIKNKHYLLALVTHDSRIIIIVIIIKINREIFAKYWVNLKQLLRNSQILWRKSKTVNTTKTSLWIQPFNLLRDTGTEFRRIWICHINHQTFFNWKLL